MPDEGRRDPGAGAPDAPAPVLVLYVSPGSAASARARRNLEAALRGYAEEAVRLDVREVTTDALRAEEDRVVFIPTLILKGGTSPAYVVGDLADRDLIVNLLRLAGVAEPSA